ncbi:MAG: acetyl-CoA carboxylase, biotin carboxyl carrier protein [Firmicutes bacterium]|nr:acetyl-CoA carboxylase, biotin carboxyl carrier protein [Bacillota bacterium]
MNFDEKSIREYASLMTELGLTAIEVEVTDKGQKLRIEKGMSASVSFPAAVPPAAAAGTPAGAVSSGDKAGHTAKGGSYVSVTSPIVGVFYAAPMENAPPYVKAGDKVKKGDTLCLIESMKLMNEVVAKEDGVITEVLVKNGQSVDYGCELFRMEAAG